MITVLKVKSTNITLKRKIPKICDATMEWGRIWHDISCHNSHNVDLSLKIQRLKFKILLYS